MKRPEDMEAEKINGSEPKQVDNLSTPPDSRNSVMDASPDIGGMGPQHALFCRMVGMPVNFGDAPYPSIWNIFNGTEKNYKGLYPRVRRAYQWHTLQYWFVACVSNSMLWLQICFGAVLTALGGLKSDRVSIAIIVIGTIQTVMGGFITYFKSRNQPNRARQFRISLARVLHAIENTECMLRDPNYVIPSYTPIARFTASHPADNHVSREFAGATVTGVEALVLRLMDMYQEATNEAQSNYPDFWSTTQKMADEDRFLMRKHDYDNSNPTDAATYLDPKPKEEDKAKDVSSYDKSQLTKPTDSGTVPSPTAQRASGSGWGTNTVTSSHFSGSSTV